MINYIAILLQFLLFDFIIKLKYVNDQVWDKENILFQMLMKNYNKIKSNLIFIVE